MAAKTGYAEIAAHYRRQIEDGELRPGDRIPSLQATCKAFDVSITTANRAFQILKSEGLTTARAGVGTVVANRPNVTATGVARITRLKRTGHEYAPGESSADHVAMMRSCADADIAEALDIELCEEVVIRRRVFRQDGKPTTVSISVIHPRALLDVPELMQQGQLKPFWHDTYTQRTGKTFTRSPERRTARMASADEMNALDVDAPDYVAVPVLVLRTTFHTEDGPIEVWEDVYAPGRWQVDGR